MKALIMTGAQQLIYADAPKPKGDDDIIVRIAAAGICGSDMHAYLGHDERRPPPLILGHEAAGETTNGKKVIINPLVVCGKCDYCRTGRDNICERREIMSMPPRPGSFAEYASAPQRNLIPLPKNLTMEQGALAEPLACGHHAAGLAMHHLRASLTNKKNTDNINNTKAMIIGGGAIGVASALSLIARGIKKVQLIETNPPRRTALKKINPKKIIPTPPPKNTPTQNKNLAQIIIDAVGNESSRRLASTNITPGGTVVHIGLASGEGGFDMRRMTLQEIILTGAYTYTAKEFTETVQWMAKGKLGNFNWHQTQPLKKGAKIFANLKTGKIPTPKTLLVPQP